MSVFTFWVFVEVCNVLSAISTNRLGADVVAHGILLTKDLSEGAIILSLPKYPVTVHLPDTNAFNYYYCVCAHM